MIISIEISSSNLSVALLKKKQILDKVYVPIKNELSEIIIPTIKNFLKKNSITFENISFITIGCGPGSFTGIRVVIAAAKGIQISNVDMKIIGINSLAGLAMSVLDEAKEKSCKYIIASIDTKRNDVFVQLFKINSLEEVNLPFSAINDIEAVEIKNLASYLTTNKLKTKNILFVGHKSELLKNKISNLKTSDQSEQIPNALWVGKLASYIIDNNIDVKSTIIAFDEFKPIYVRPAEINE